HTRLVSDWSSDVCSSDLPLVGEGKVLELQLALAVARVGEELLQQLTHEAGGQAVVVVLAVAAVAHQADHAHQRQVVADGGLRLGLGGGGGGEGGGEWGGA